MAEPDPAFQSGLKNIFEVKKSKGKGTTDIILYRLKKR
ncbi:hypothetical Protein YC6258_01391 [Gynuella sunshinyii YC6258]|uniref:Uncharacterized protein n=1 Tax=Gynuella sunshinyii YC6258 TaxID=1445510 RepID=A0A0C5VSY8_9GAMM|nr:hypothetical Protein YC6258_01391 [Gynuella sunshinyii YC6258]